MQHYCPRCGYEQQPNWRTWANAHPVATFFISAVAALFGVFMVAVVSVYPLSGWSIVAVSVLGAYGWHRYNQHLTAKALATRADWEYRSHR